MYTTDAQLELVKKALQKRDVQPTEEVMNCMRHFIIITVASEEELINFFPEGENMMELGPVMVSHLLEKEVIEKTRTCYELNSTFKKEIEIEE